MRTEAIRRMQLSLLGKMETTLVRRRICLFRFSSMLEVLRRRRTGSGRLKMVKPSGRAVSIQVARSGAVFGIS